MTLESFTPTLREDGTFDPDCLERAGLRWVTAWLKGRLSGKDPYFPVDRRGGEDPEALVITILRGAGTAHPATDLIARALLALLDEARAGAPDIPPYLKPALRICQQVRLPQASSWFTEELKALADESEAVEARWGEKIVREILYAASLQAPGLTQAASHESWWSLLSIPRYATLAWVGLGQSFPQRMSYIVDWWNACPAAKRNAEIDHVIFMGLKTEGDEEARLVVKSVSAQWPHDLKSAVDEAFEKHGLPGASWDGRPMSFRDLVASLQALLEAPEPAEKEAFSGQGYLKAEAEELRRLHWENERFREERERIKQRLRMAVSGPR